jgi:hypothetical protein
MKMVLVKVRITTADRGLDGSRADDSADLWTLCAQEAAQKTQDQLRKLSKVRGALKQHANRTANTGPMAGGGGEALPNELRDPPPLVATGQERPAEKIRSTPAEHLSGDSNAEPPDQMSCQPAAGFGCGVHPQDPCSWAHTRSRRRTSR